MNKHTPGKWVAFSNHGRLLIHADAIPICGSNYAHEAQNVADFKLMAAAPELLEVVKQFVYFAEAFRTREYEPNSPTVKELILNARAALTKAGLE